MLVLSRKEGEKLVIGNNVVLTVTRISGNRVTIGIEAPREVSVVRGELELREAVEPASRSSQASPKSASMIDQGIAVAGHLEI